MGAPAYKFIDLSEDIDKIPTSRAHSLLLSTAIVVRRVICIWFLKLAIAAPMQGVTFHVVAFCS